MAKPYHILMVLDEVFPPDVRVENEARTLVAAGFKVSLLSLAPYPNPVDRKTFDHRGTTVIRKHTPRPVRNKMRGLAATIPAMSLYVSRQVQRVCASMQVDALHVHDLWLFGGGLRAAQKLDIPMVGDLHENYVEALSGYAWSTSFPNKYLINLPRWKKLERQWMRRSTRLVCVNEAQRARYESFGIRPAHVAVTPNTIALDEFNSYSVDEDLIASNRSDFTIIYTGSFDYHRGLDILIRSIPRVIERCNAHLTLVGDGRVRAELEELVTSLGLGEHVTFTGWQPQHLVKSYILASDAGVIPFLKGPHTDAATPHKLFHYMHLKRPLVTTDCTLIQHVVESSEAGIVVPSGSSEALADALVDLWRQPELRARMGQNGREAVKSRYNWDVTVKDMIAMYHDLASG